MAAISLPESMLTQLTGAYMRHYPEMSDIDNSINNGYFAARIASHDLTYGLLVASLSI